MLHLIFQSPVEIATLQRIGDDNSVLFLESAVFSLLKNAALSSQLVQLSTTNCLSVLLSDIETRGIRPAELTENIKVIDYLGFVALTEQHKIIQSWF